jgi:hypothetical protein
VSTVLPVMVRVPPEAGAGAGAGVEDDPEVEPVDVPFPLGADDDPDEAGAEAAPVSEEITGSACAEAPPCGFIESSSTIPAAVAALVTIIRRIG